MTHSLDEFLKKARCFCPNFVLSLTTQLLERLFGVTSCCRHLLGVDNMLKQQTGFHCNRSLCSAHTCSLLIQAQFVVHFCHGAVVSSGEWSENMKLGTGTLSYDAVLYLLSTLMCAFHQWHGLYGLWSK